MSRHAVPFADTQYLSRTHSVFRAYGEGYAGRRLGILLSRPEGEVLWREIGILQGRSCPSYGRIGRFSVDRNAIV